VPHTHTHLCDLPLVEKSLQDLVVFNEVVLKLGVVVDLFHLHLALLSPAPQSVAQDTACGPTASRAKREPCLLAAPVKGDQERTAPQAGSMRGRSGRVGIDAAEGGGAARRGTSMIWQ